MAMTPIPIDDFIRQLEKACAQFGDDATLYDSESVECEDVTGLRVTVRKKNGEFGTFILKPGEGSES